MKYLRFYILFQEYNLYSYLKIENFENEESVKSKAMSELLELGATIMSIETVNLTESPDFHTLEKCCFFLSEVGECANSVFLGNKPNGCQVAVVKESNNPNLIGLAFWMKGSLKKGFFVIGEYCSLLIDADRFMGMLYYCKGGGLICNNADGLFAHKQKRDNLLSQAKGRAIEDFYQQSKEVAAKLLSDSTGLNFEAKDIDKRPYMTNRITASFICHYPDKFQYDIWLYYRDMPSDHNRHGWKCEFSLPQKQ